MGILFLKRENVLPQVPENVLSLRPENVLPLGPENYLLQRGVVVAADCQQRLSLRQLSMLKVNMKSLGVYLFYI